MDNMIFGRQLSFNDNFDVSEEKQKDIWSDIYSKINAAKKNDYKMPRELYNEIMSKKMHPNVYAILLNGVRPFNLTYDRCYSNNDDVVRIDAVGVYKKILHSKDAMFIGISLNMLKLEADDCTVEKYKMEAKYIYDKCVSSTIDFLKESDDKKFTYDFLCFSEINWNDNFAFLLKFIETCGISDKFLWERIVKLGLLNKKNIEILLNEKTTLMIMYLIHRKTKFSGKDKKRIKDFLSFKKVQDEIKEIDLSFYNTKINPLLTGDNVILTIDKKNQEKLFRGFEDKLSNIIRKYVFHDEEDLQISLFSMGHEKEENNEVDAPSKKINQSFKGKFKKDAEE